jgi:hypothetical protein
MNRPPPNPPDDFDDVYRRASGVGPGAPSESVRRAILEHAAELATQRRPPTAASPRAARRWRPAAFGGLAAAMLAGLLIAPRFLAPPVPTVAPAPPPEPTPALVSAPAPAQTPAPAQAPASAPVSAPIQAPASIPTPAPDIATARSAAASTSFGPRMPRAPAPAPSDVLGKQALQPPPPSAPAAAPHESDRLARTSRAAIASPASSVPAAPSAPAPARAAAASSSEALAQAPAAPPNTMNQPIQMNQLVQADRAPSPPRAPDTERDIASASQGAGAKSSDLQEAAPVARAGTQMSDAASDTAKTPSLREVSPALNAVTQPDRPASETAKTRSPREAAPEALSNLTVGSTDLASVLAATLRSAAESGDLPRLRALLAKRPTDLEARDPAGRSALLLAVLHGQAAAVDALLAAGANPNSAAADGTTPLQAARSAHEASIAAALRRAGAR